MRLFSMLLLGMGLVFAQGGFSQTESLGKVKKRKGILDHNVLVQGNLSTNSSLELGYAFLSARERSFKGVSLSSEHFLRHDYRMCVKPRAFFSAMNVLVGVSVPYVFDFKGKQDVYLKPELGLTLGWAHIVYSNNIPFASEVELPIPAHNIGIGINFLWGTFE